MSGSGSSYHRAGAPTERRLHVASKRVAIRRMGGDLREENGGKRGGWENAVHSGSPLYRTYGHLRRARLLARPKWLLIHAVRSLRPRAAARHSLVVSSSLVR